MMSMTDLVSQTLNTMQQQLQQQDLPNGALYIVATPIGNMADISFRAVHVLNHVDGIACEDTRHTAPLLSSLGIHKPLLALHEHNEREAAEKLAAYLKEGQRWAYVSDAGTPGISDPGARLVDACIAHGLRVIPIPGASALTSIASIAGSAINNSNGEFQFLGFFPSKTKEQKEFIHHLNTAPIASVFYESPHRITATLNTLIESISDQNRKVVIGRELTKKFETIEYLKVHEIAAWLEKKPNLRGEFAIIVGPSIQDTPSNLQTTFNALELIKALEPHMGSKQIAEVLNQVADISKKDAYQLALDNKKPAA